MMRSWPQLPSRRPCLLLPRHLEVQQTPYRLLRSVLHKTLRVDKVALPSTRLRFRALVTRTRILNVSCRKVSKAKDSHTKHITRLQRSLYQIRLAMPSL
jgi:hypothetical protein